MKEVYKCPECGELVPNEPELLRVWEWDESWEHWVEKRRPVCPDCSPRWEGGMVVRFSQMGENAA